MVWGTAGQVNKDWGKSTNKKIEDKAKDWSDAIIDCVLLNKSISYLVSSWFSILTV